MGTKMVPPYATLVLGYLEQKLYEQLGIKYENEFSPYIQQNWKRFLDDCFVIWNSEITVEDFHLHLELNSLNPHIKFTMNRQIRPSTDDIYTQPS